MMMTMRRRCRGRPYKWGLLCTSLDKFGSSLIYSNGPNLLIGWRRESPSVGMVGGDSDVMVMSMMMMSYR